MQIYVEGKRKKIETIRKQYSDAEIVDVTSKADRPWIKFSPFYPHGNIPIPFSSNAVGASVEGVWQGLKVFEQADIDIEIINKTSMSGIKRTTRKYGKVKGHRQGIGGTSLLSYAEARRHIYLPCYRYVLENHLEIECHKLRELACLKSVVLLDYETNGDLDNLNKPLSHACLIVKFLQNDWPEIIPEVV
jgi:hypothetical protein